MYKYEITLIDNTLLMATSLYSMMCTLEQEFAQVKNTFIRIGDVIIRRHLVKSVREVKIDE